jgi:hypothetical protein
MPNGYLKERFVFRLEQVPAQVCQANSQLEYFSLKAFRRSIFFRTFALCKLLRSEPLRR